MEAEEQIINFNTLSVLPLELKILRMEMLIEDKSGIPNKTIQVAKLRNLIAEESGVKQKGVIGVGNYVLTWHPKVKSKINPDGTMMIFTRETYNRMKGYDPSTPEK